MTSERATHSLLFVDDHPLYREGMRRTLAEALPELRVFVAEDEPSALATLKSNAEVDLCLADYRLGQSDGIALLRRIGADHPDVARGLLCAALTPELVQNAKAIGCVACLSKDRDAERLADALRRLFGGHTVFDEPVARRTADGDPRTLSARRMEVLRLAAAGMSNKEIGRKLGIVERSVKDHWARIFEQLGVSTRTEAVGVAFRRNLL